MLKLTKEHSDILHKKPETGKLCFTITPTAGITIRWGTVQPAFNQSGGGVEIFFPDGTDNGSVSEPYLIADR